MIRLTKSIYRDSEKVVYKVFDNDEFIGYLEQYNYKWIYNPLPDITLKSFEFDSWTDAHEYLQFRNY